MSLPRTPILTERLRLVPVDPAHLDAMYAAIEASRPELRPWLAWAEGDAAAEAAFLRSAAAGWEEGRVYAFGAWRGEEVVGAVGLHLSEHLPWTGSIGYWARSDAAGQGYVTEAATALVRFAFDTVGLQRLELLAGVDNRASRRVAEKLGFRQEGVARAAAVGAGGSYDCASYGLLRSDLEITLQPSPAAARAAAEPDFGRGLVSAIAQDDADGTVLMLAHMDAEAYRRTISTGHAWFWSRSRNELWEKGATSGAYLDVVSVTVDCDGDAVLLRVRPHGPACHTGERSCFHNPASTGGPEA